MFFVLKVEIALHGTKQTLFERKLCSLHSLSLEGVVNTHNTGTTLNCFTLIFCHSSLQTLFICNSTTQLSLGLK